MIQVASVQPFDEVECVTHVRLEVAWFDRRVILSFRDPVSKTDPLDMAVLERTDDARFALGAQVGAAGIVVWGWIMETAGQVVVAGVEECEEHRAVCVCSEFVEVRSHAGFAGGGDHRVGEVGNIGHGHLIWRLE